MNRDASAVLLVRGEHRGLEVYLVERSPQLRFFGGYLALPGGVRSPEDETPAGTGKLSDGPFRSCAVRELFEETGVLLAANPATATERRAARETLLQDHHEAWSRLTSGAGAEERLELICRIHTPPFAPVRYDTLFFLARLPEGEEPDIWPGELSGGRFWRPEEALDAWRRGEVSIVPPVIILLELLVHGDTGRFLTEVQSIAEEYQRGVLHRVRFSPGVIMAALKTPTLPPATTTNCLIVGEQSLYVIDPATPDTDEQERLFNLLDRLRAEGRRVEGILLTHHHPDHVGAVSALSRRDDLSVRAHRLTLERLPEPAALGAPIEDGEVIPLGTAPDGTPDWSLEAIFTPGHDRGHLCFRESRYDAVIAGDMLSTVSTIVIDPPEGHMRTYLESLRRLEATPMSTLYPAHGPAAREGHKLVRKYLRHRAERQDKLVASLRRGPTTAAQLLPVVYDDVDARMHPIAARSLLAGLQMLEEDGEARVVGGVWELVGRASD